MRRLTSLLIALLALSSSMPAHAASAPEHIVVVVLPDVFWDDITASTTPTLDAMAQAGATGNVAVRTAVARTDSTAAFMTLGAGNRAVSAVDASLDDAFSASQDYGPVTATEALTSRVGAHRAGEIVHLGIAQAQNLQTLQPHGALVGALGDSLRQAGVETGVVSAADLSITARTPSHLRRSAVLAVAGSDGVVDFGSVNDLEVAAPGRPFSVRTDPTAFQRAVEATLQSAKVVVVDPGETSRASEFAPEATPDRQIVMRRRALEDADALIRGVRESLTSSDLLMVIGVPGPLRATLGRLSPMIVEGPGFSKANLISPSTRRPGLITLTDVAPSILAQFGIPKHPAMTGSVITASANPALTTSALADMDHAAAFREGFSTVVFYAYVGLLVALGIAAFFAFLGRKPASRELVAALSYFILAVPPATMLIRLLDTATLGALGAHLVLWSITGILGVLAWRVPGPRWAGAVALMLALTVLVAADLATGGRFAVNAIFGNSLIAAGRFYGISNTGFAILYGAGILGLTGLADLRGQQRAPYWVLAGLGVMVALVGLPPLGANFGGLLTGVITVAIVWLLARYGRIRWKAVILAGVGAALVTAAVTIVDMMRPVADQTHLGRFATSIATGHLSAAWIIVSRKAGQSLGSLGFTRWTYAIPVAIAVVALLLQRPRGVLADVIPQHPVIRAGLWGVLVAGVVGFAVNDSGIVIPAMLVSQAVPLLVLMGVETLAPRRPTAARE